MQTKGFVLTVEGPRMIRCACGRSLVWTSDGGICCPAGHCEIVKLKDGVAKGAAGTVAEVKLSDVVEPSQQTLLQKGYR